MTNKQYWLNHYNPDTDEIVSNSGLGAKCKVEIISRSELLNARGYVGRPLSVTSLLEDSLEQEQQEEQEEQQGNPPIVNFGFEVMEFGPPPEALDDEMV